MLGYALEWRDKHIIAGPLLLEPMNSVKECVHACTHSHGIHW